MYCIGATAAVVRSPSGLVLPDNETWFGLCLYHCCVEGNGTWRRPYGTRSQSVFPSTHFTAVTWPHPHPTQQTSCRVNFSIHTSEKGGVVIPKTLTVRALHEAGGRQQPVEDVEGEVERLDVLPKRHEAPKVDAAHLVSHGEVRPAVVELARQRGGFVFVLGGGAPCIARGGGRAGGGDSVCER